MVQPFVRREFQERHPGVLLEADLLLPEAWRRAQLQKHVQKLDAMTTTSARRPTKKHKHELELYRLHSFGGEVEAPSKKPNNQATAVSWAQTSHRQLVDYLQLVCPDLPPGMLPRTAVKLPQVQSWTCAVDKSLAILLKTSCTWSFSRPRQRQVMIWRSCIQFAALRAS